MEKLAGFHIELYNFQKEGKKIVYKITQLQIERKNISNSKMTVLDLLEVAYLSDIYIYHSKMLF